MAWGLQIMTTQRIAMTNGARAAIGSRDPDEEQFRPRPVAGRNRFERCGRPTTCEYPAFPEGGPRARLAGDLGAEAEVQRRKSC